MGRYAADTSVSADRSRAEIEAILTRYEASHFAYGWSDTASKSRAMIGFRLANRMIRFELFMPSKTDPKFHKTPTGRSRKQAGAALQAWEQETRQRWRALALVVKAKLEAVDSGISSVEDEFLAWIVLPDGKTVAEITKKAIHEAYETGKVKALLPGF